MPLKSFCDMCDTEIKANSARISQQKSFASNSKRGQQFTISLEINDSNMNLVYLCHNCARAVMINLLTIGDKK